MKLQLSFQEKQLTAFVANNKIGSYKWKLLCFKNLYQSLWAWQLLMTEGDINKYYFLSYWMMKYVKICIICKIQWARIFQWTTHGVTKSFISKSQFRVQDWPLGLKFKIVKYFLIYQVICYDQHIKNYLLMHFMHNFYKMLLKFSYHVQIHTYLRVETLHIPPSNVLQETECRSRHEILIVFYQTTL
jgi:hypothetical protein